MINGNKQSLKGAATNALQQEQSIAAKLGQAVSGANGTGRITSNRHGRLTEFMKFKNQRRKKYEGINRASE